MTCKEKWEQITGEKMNPWEACPHKFGLIKERNEELCKRQYCDECWEREADGLPETEEKTEEKSVVPEILDSGDRTLFPSGACRDMREGKGRFDVMPLEVVANYIYGADEGIDTFLWAVAKFLKTNSTEYLYSAINLFEVLVWDDRESMLLDVAVHYEQGAKKYGPSNWRKSIPTWCYIDSAVRHYIKWRRGDTDEAHHRAVIWNLLCCIWEVDYNKKETTE